MELTQQVRDYAKQQGVSDAEAINVGMAHKSKEFKQKNEIYVDKLG
jgi:phosphomethylpyrimidine synthase